VTDQESPRGRVLVVDDEPDLVRVLEFGLKASGYTVEVASDGQEGLKKAREIKPDVILLDLMLPKLDGYKVCRLLKFDDRFKHIPIIILSARTQEGDQTLALEMGANRFVIIKPACGLDVSWRVNVNFRELLGGL